MQDASHIQTLESETAIYCMEVACANVWCGGADSIQIRSLSSGEQVHAIASHGALSMCVVDQGAALWCSGPQGTFVYDTTSFELLRTVTPPASSSNDSFIKAMALVPALAQMWCGDSKGEILIFSTTGRRSSRLPLSRVDCLCGSIACLLACACVLWPIRPSSLYTR
mgnify:CR=1 FL=1